MARVFYHADNLLLLPMGGQVIPLVWARKFQTNLDYISEKGQNCNRSDIKSRFDNMGFSTCDTILRMLSFRKFPSVDRTLSFIKRCNKKLRH